MTDIVRLQASSKERGGHLFAGFSLCMPRSHSFSLLLFPRPSFSALSISSTLSARLSWLSSFCSSLPRACLKLSMISSVQAKKSTCSLKSRSERARRAKNRGESKTTGKSENYMMHDFEAALESQM